MPCSTISEPGYSAELKDYYLFLQKTNYKYVPNSKGYSKNQEKIHLNIR